MCNCKCSCSCDVIDTTKPEDYEVLITKSWYPVVQIYLGQGIGIRYHVVYVTPEAHTVGTTVSKEYSEGRFRKKKKWEPTPGKLYMYSDDDNLVGTLKGFVRQACRVVGYKGCWRAVSSIIHGDVVQWKYCWPIPIDKLQEEAGE